MAFKLTLWAAGALVATAAPAMSLVSAGNVGHGVAIADPDERLDRMAAASNPTDGRHGKPHRSARNILRADPNLRAAFAWLDNQ